MMSKAVLVDLSRILLRETSAYFAKFVDTFEKLSRSHQIGFLEYITEEIGIASMERKAADRMQHRSLLIDILMYFSGNSRNHQPDTKELVRHIGIYMKSKQFIKAEKASPVDVPFLDAMEELAK